MTDPFEKVLPGRPDERALNAMAEVVRRARQMTQATAGEPTGPTAEVPPIDAARDGPGHPPVPSGPHRRERPPREVGPSRPTERVDPGTGRRVPLGEKALQVSVVVVGVLVLGLGSAVVTLRLSGHVDAPAVPTATGRVQGHASPTTGVRGRPAPSPSPNASAPLAVPSPPPATSAEQPAAPGHTPQLTALSPTGGSAGQVVTVSGVNLFSADGVVQALVGGAPAPTSCSTETACRVTVPARTGPPSSLPLTIETDAGTSNALAFSYGR